MTGKRGSVFICLQALIFTVLTNSPVAAGEPGSAPAAQRNAAVVSSCREPNLAVAAYTSKIQWMQEHRKGVVELLREFPKGADIHNHLSGAILPEDYLALGVHDGSCYGGDKKYPGMETVAVSLSQVGAFGVCPPDFKPLASADREDRGRIIGSLSMYRYPYPDIQSGHDQFFATFGRFGAISGRPWNFAPMMAALLRQEEADGVSYVETMVGFQSQAMNTLAGLLRQRFPDPRQYLDSDNYPAMYGYLLTVGLQDAVEGAKIEVDDYVRRTSALLACGSPAKDPACRVGYAFLSAVNRNASMPDGSPDLAKIFTQAAFSMTLASPGPGDPRVVGVNLLSGEDAPISLQSFDTQMQFFGYLHNLFPAANIALHAGEFTPCFVGAGSPVLKKHLSGSLKAGAKRIGHGVSFAYLSDQDKAEVARQLKQNNTLVEIMFTSNAQILGVAGDDHPFLQYRKYGVPLAFSTDDAGVSHSDYTSEWVYAVNQYHLTGDDLVRLGRESFEHSFLAGASLWADLSRGAMVKQCGGIVPGSSNPAEPCKGYLQGNPKAALQWEYEARLARFARDPRHKLLWPQ